MKCLLLIAQMNMVPGRVKNLSQHLEHRVSFAAECCCQGIFFRSGHELHWEVQEVVDYAPKSVVVLMHNDTFKSIEHMVSYLNSDFQKERPEGKVHHIPLLMF